MARKPSMYARQRAARDYTVAHSLIGRALEIPVRVPGKRKHSNLPTVGHKTRKDTIRERKQEILQSSEFHRLPKEQKILVRQAVNIRRENLAQQQEFQNRLQSIRKVSPEALTAERVIHSQHHRALSFKQIVKLLLRIPANERKSVFFSRIFSVPARGKKKSQTRDRLRLELWEKIRSAISKHTIHQVMEDLKRIIQTTQDRDLMCKRLANHLSRISPAARADLLDSLDLTNAEKQKISKIKKQQWQEVISHKATQRQNGLQAGGPYGQQHPHLQLKGDYYSLYKQFAAKEVAKRIAEEARERTGRGWKESKRERREKLKNYMPAVYEFMEFLREQAEKRGITVSELMGEIQTTKSRFKEFAEKEAKQKIQ